MKALKILTGKHKKPCKIDHYKIHEKSISGSELSAQTNIIFSQDITNPSVSSSLSCIWELDDKQRPPGLTSSSKTMSEKTVSKTEIEEINSACPNEQSNIEKDKLVNTTDAELTRNSSDVEKNSRPITSSDQSAAAFYGGISLRNDSSVLEMCESIDRLNQYLKARKDDVKAGVPGKFLHVVIGQEVADVGSVVSTITYAFFLNETQTSSQICIFPVINIKRADFTAHSELKWLLNTCLVDESSVIFIDEIDLSYHNRFGNLKLVLVNGQKLPPKQERLQDAPIEVFNCKDVKTGSASLEDFITIGQNSSCCTLIAEKYADTSPEILAGPGFSRLLLSGILLDTKNLSSNCTSKDKYMVTLLIKGAGRFGCSGLYNLLKYKMSDISDLKVKDILHRDFKKWSRVSGRSNSISHIGMSSIGISIEELLNIEDSAANEVILFQGSEKLRLLMIVSGYDDSQKSFKREILVSTNTPELMKKFLQYLSTNGANLPLKSMKQLDLRDELRAFEINNMLTSRRSIAQLLEEFDGALRKQ